jgi:MFS family permease
MMRPGFWPLAWGILIGASSAILWGFAYGLPQSGGACASATCVAQPALQAGLLSAAGLVSALIGIVLLARRSEGIDRARRPIADQSMATAVAAIGLGLVALWGAFGAWLVYIGAGVTAAGIGGVIREGLAIRELRRRDPGP